ncbi:MAG: exo-alpha-sialidase [Flavobacteriales bacterium]|nr:exo-alpha-sialidase [Flavobacteriales bacterium]
MTKLFLSLVGLFAIVHLANAQTIEILTPNGGEVWQGCTTQTITWTASGTSNFYSIDYSVNNGVNWTSIATFYNTTIGEYEWTLPSIQSTNVLIRVQDSNNTAIQDISSATFSMIAPLVVTSPNGGEVWEGGTTHAITWVQNGTSYYYVLEYSLDGGNTWNTINSYLYNTSGSYNWNVPNTPSTAALVRVSDYNAPCKTDKSNTVFEISPATPVITVTSPSNNQTRYVGENATVSWNSQYVVSNQVQIEYSSDNGSTWNLITGLTENDGSFPWLVPDDISTQCIVKVTDLTNTSTYGLSSGLFTIAAPFIQIQYPNGGELENQCYAVNINWTHGGTHPNRRFNLRYSTDNGSTWNTIATNVYQSNGANSNYSWNYPPPSGSVLIKIEDYYNNLLYDVSDAPFTLQPHNDLIIVSPNGGNVWEAGTTQSITWADNNINYVNMELSLDGGATWSQFDSYESSDGLYYWVVPNTPSTQCLIRLVESDYQCKTDVSDNVFTITPPTPVIQNVAPGNVANQVYYSGMSAGISWTSAFLTSSFVAIDISYDDGATFTEIISATENDGAYTWLIPEVYSETSRIRVREVGSAVSGMSANPFSIREPFITVLYPNGGETEGQCSSFVISWSHGGVHQNKRFSLYYSTDGGSTWNTIVTNLYQSNGTLSQYTWTYPPPSGSTLIKVQDYYNSSLFDVSDAAFAMAPNNDLIITYPTGGETLIVGTLQTLTWASSGISYVDMEISLDGGATWTMFDTYEYSDGNYSWTVPNTPSNNCLLRFSESDYGCSVYEMSTPFSIEQPAPSVTYPNTALTLYQGQSVNIQWTNAYFPDNFVVVEYSTDGGSTWNMINAAAYNDGYEPWLVPADFSSECLVRVTDFGNPLITDESDVFFTISPSIVVTSPNGDNGIQDWRVCTETTITWTSGGTSNYFRLWYSVDNGNTWISLNSNYYSPGFENTYDWVMPNIPTPAALVRVDDRYNSSQTDVSDDTFTIAPAITVLTPNGGETLASGNVVDITWLNEGATNYYNIDYSTNGGSTWNSIAVNAFIVDDTYSWTIPGTLGTNYLVRVTDNIDNCKSDMSDGTFEVSAEEQGLVEVVAPNGLETWAGCTQHTISWTSVSTSDYYDIEYSVDGGTTWTMVVANYYTLTKNYTWTVPGVNTTNALVRVTDHNSLLFTDESNVQFTITAPIANAGNDVTICQGASVVLQASGGVSYSWSPAGSLDSSSGSTVIASPAATTTYTVVVTDTNGCSDSDDVTVTVDNGLCDIEGCMETNAYNYNPNATIDDGTCLFETGGGPDTCPTDINNDGQTDTGDLLLMLGGFGSICE